MIPYLSDGGYGYTIFAVKVRSSLYVPASVGAAEVKAADNILSTGVVPPWTDKTSVGVSLFNVVYCVSPILIE